MKILKLKFRNINSLAGDWEIDFTQPEFTENGLFAITGKTGSGKSSILDAVSLALYGKTPRVDVTGSNNDVMTRGTSDCYAEIAFEVGGRIWKASWKQERARKKADGNLKQVERVIADENDRIVADKISMKGAKQNEDEKTVNEKIVDIIGLTFEQFTKVILLAQGSFAAFLQADKSDKGELLEQITGTEIYGEISRKVFERNKIESQKLEILDRELGAIAVLSEEEMEKLNLEIGELEKQKEQTDKDLQIIAAAQNQIRELNNLQKQINDAKAKLPELIKEEENTKKIFENTEKEVVSIKQEQEKFAPVFVKVRELDTKIAEKDKALNPLILSIENLGNDRNDLQKTIENRFSDLQQNQNSLKQLQEWAVKNAKYENLNSLFAAIENQNSQVKNLLDDFNFQNAELHKNQEDLKHKIAVFNNAQTACGSKENELNEKMQEFKTKELGLTTILAGKQLSDYQKEKENIIQSGTNIKNLIEAEKNMLENQKEIERNKKIIDDADKSEQELLRAISGNKTDLETLDKQIILLEENIKLAQKIKSLDEHRRSLEDGKPCPLCGATEHPFAFGNEPKIGEKETELKNLKMQRQKIADLRMKDENTLAELISDRKNALQNNEKESKKQSENNEKQNTILAEIKKLNPDFSIPENIDRINFLEDSREKMLEKHKQIISIITDAENCEKQLKKLQNEEIPQLQTVKQTAEKAKTDAETAQKLTEQQVKTQVTLTTKAKESYETANRELLSVFAEYEVSTIENLKKCLYDWNENKQKTADFNKQITEINNDILLKNNELENKIKLFDEKQTEKSSIETDKQTIVNQRVEIFGNKKTDDEENRLKERLNNAESAKSAAEKRCNEAKTEIAKTEAIVQESETRLFDEQAKNSTEKTPEELQIEHEEKKRQSDEFSQKIGASRQILETNNEKLVKNRKKLSEKELQQQISDRWKRLDILIGSSDGKKYRNFAQSLTFENLIALANKQLNKMSERYILKRTGDWMNPFELSVIDKFQNCDERTAQNLSGGEKFIVSLALALGLSNMASRNMKIDTMFIDEGFGTLDSDYLNVALTALSNLQNEGKLIGVISHLAELKERIVTHIEVIPKGDGHSTVEIVC